MASKARLAKLSVRRLEKATEYATESFVRESLRTFEARYSLPIQDAIRFLEQGRVDSISLNKETPYANFHATRFKDRIIVSIREGSKDIDLELPIPTSIDLIESRTLDPL